MHEKRCPGGGCGTEDALSPGHSAAAHKRAENLTAGVKSYNIATFNFSLSSGFLSFPSSAERKGNYTPLIPESAVHLCSVNPLFSKNPHT